MLGNHISLLISQEAKSGGKKTLKNVHSASQSDSPCHYGISLYSIHFFAPITRFSHDLRGEPIGSDIQPDTTKLLAYRSETKCRWHHLAPVGNFLGEVVHYLIIDSEATRTRDA